VHTEVAAPATTTGGFAPAPTGLGDYVTASPEKIQAAVREFMHPRAAKHRKVKESAKKKRGGKKRARVSAATYRLVPKLSAAKEIVRPALAGSGFKFPVYAPAWLTAKGRYPASTGVAPSPRLYSIRDRHGRRHRAYRLVVEENQSEGQYYGIQGTTWQSPPILDGKHSTQRLNGRSFHVYLDGSHIRLVSWHTARGVYWVSNTLSRDITNRQMLGIARSLTRIRR
jgi:hypothetical protein